MSKKDQIKSEKDRILVALNREDRYMSPNEIAQSTRLNLKPHVIRDRLKDLVEEGKVTRQGIARGTKYKLVKTHSAAIRMTLPTPTVKARG
jgi:predicted ArsR family transcriptional regulator